MKSKYSDSQRKERARDTKARYRNANYKLVAPVCYFDTSNESDSHRALLANLAKSANCALRQSSQTQYARVTIHDVTEYIEIARNRFAD